MIKDIKYNGYTAQPSDHESPDGDLAAAINVIAEDGHIRVIPRARTVLRFNSSTRRAIFIHDTPSYTHYISYDTTSFKLSWHDGLSEDATEIPTPFFNLSHCNAIGNTLIVFTDTATHYLLWSDNTYLYLGDHIPEVDISFGLVGHPRLFSLSDSSKSKFTVSFAEGINESDIRADFSDANKSAVTQQVMAKLNKFIREQTVNKGRFCFPFFVRYALRLFDGSLIHHSAPILMNPSTQPAPLVMWSRVKGKDKYSEADGCDIMLVAANLDYQVHQYGEVANLDLWKDIVRSVDIFISAPIYTYDQNGLITNLSDTDNFDTSFIGKLYHRPYHADGDATFPDTITEDCMAGPLDLSGNGTFLSHYMEWSYPRIYQLYFANNSARPYPGETFHLPEFTDGKNLESLTGCSSFYLLHSLSLDDLKVPGRTTVPVEDDYLQSLVTREAMTDDYLSHDSIAASTSYLYNSRLNLSGVRRRLFSGFSPFSMFAYCDARLTTYSLDNNTVSLACMPQEDSIQATVYIKEGGHTFARNVSSPVRLAPWGSVKDADGTLRRSSWGCFFFYPNVNAYKVVITSYYGRDNGNAAIAIDLRPHDFLNGAYALLDYNTTRTHNCDTPPAVDTDAYSLLDCGNKVYTSEVNNPFFFPVTGINTIGTGTIMGMASAAKALSQGQFGQFPLYAFTSEGVWAMEVGATGTYTARQPITRDVCINADSITQIDSSVLFATDRGIMLISGSDTQCISDTVNTDTPFDYISLPAIHRLLAEANLDSDDGTGIVPFSDFLRHCRMLYDYTHRRIFVFSDGFPYTYVYSLKSRLWAMMRYDFSLLSPLNSYPDAMVMAVGADGNNIIVDFSDVDASPIGGFLLTRPLRLDAPDILKTVSCVIQRGLFRRGHVISAIYGSRDLFSWHLVWSSRDHYLRGFRGTPYRHFRIALALNLAPDESIYGATLDFTPRLTNQPR